MEDDNRQMPSDQAIESTDIRFSDDDRLALLQLLIRRAITERRARERDLNLSGGDDQAESTPQPHSSSIADSQTAPPSLWRLVTQGVTLHAWQRRCMELWLPKGRGTVKVATGGGKTVFALAASEQLQHRVPELRVAIVVPTIPLMYQWRDDLLQSNLPPTAIGLMGGGQQPDEIDNIRVLVAVVNSAKDRLTALARKAAWPPRMLLIVDECHRANAMQSQRIFNVGATYTLGLSATPESDVEMGDIPSNEQWNSSPAGLSLGPIIFDFSIQDSLQAGLLTPFEVWHVGLPLTPSEAEKHNRLSRQISDLRKSLQARHRSSKSKQGFLAWCQTMAARRQDADATSFIGLANERKRLLYRATARGEAVLSFLKEATEDPESRAIVFHESIAETERLFAAAVATGLPATLEHSKLPDSLRDESIEAFRRGTARCIVSAKSLIEGFNVPSADVGIIAASTGSVRQRIQSLGRMLRRKEGDRTARIIVLYIRDTEDEAIYAKADWESIMGAERNRYFDWNPPASVTEGWQAGFRETGVSPRQFRPSSLDVDATVLVTGEPYPGQTMGDELHVDQAGNLRTSDGALVSAPPNLVQAIVELNPLRRAVCTPAGHLIARVDTTGGPEQDWRYLGVLDMSQSAETLVPEERYRFKSTGGRRVIVWKVPGRGREEKYALGPDKATDPDAATARDRLLEWVFEIERERAALVLDLLWSSERGYWVELNGEIIPCPGVVARLEFAQ